MLARGENLQVQSENIGMMGEQVTMTESKYVSRISLNLRFIHTSDCLLDDFDCEWAGLQVLEHQKWFFYAFVPLIQ